VSSAPAAEPLLKLQGLTHHYRSRQRRQGGKPVLYNLNLDVAAGQITVLLGPSGCGKSTLLNLAAGLADLQQGCVQVDGRSIHGPHPRVGVVFQQPALLPWLNVYRNVEFGLTLRHSEPLSRLERHERILEALELVGLRHHPSTLPSHLSGGMAQRVALARVLVKRPRLLLLDEPFSALDAVTRAEMQALLHSIVARLGTGVLIVTHDVDEALALGDRILLMKPHPGQIHRDWPGVPAHDQLARLELRHHILRELSAILQP
jgi:NitT/TauT family transport system ATP-binding protein